MDSKSLWLTQLDEPNDLNNALTFIQQVIKTSYPGLSASLFTMDKVGQFPVYSFSLTTQKDQESLWQTVKPGNGYSYSFDVDQLSASKNNAGLTLLRSLYDDGEKTSFIINSIVAISPSDYIQSLQQDDPISTLDPRHFMFAKQIKLINRNILNYVGILKDVSSQQEQEWRIAATYTWSNIFMGPVDIDPDPLPLEVKSATSGRTSVNYLEVPLINESFTTVNIAELIIGPSQDISQSKSDCENVLTEQGNPNVIISESSIPFGG